MVSLEQFFCKIMLICTQLELPSLPTQCSNSAMAGLLPDLYPIEHVWDQLKRQMLLCHSARDLEVAVQDLWARLPQDNIRRLINSMLRHVLQQEGVQHAIDFALYLSQWTPCICLIVLILRSSVSLIIINPFIKFHFNPMLSSWGAIFNVSECIKLHMNYPTIDYLNRLLE